MGYLIGKASARILEIRVNVPLILALSIIPDVDILFKPLIEHRGPTHSIIVLLIVSLPFFAVYRKRAAPYFLAVLSHPLVGDFFIGGNIRLLWPLSTGYFGLSIPITSPTNIALEWLMFLASMIAMVRLKDFVGLFQGNLSNLLLSIPTFTVLLPAFLRFPLGVPVWLEPPHLIYMFFFIVAMTITLFELFHRMKLKLRTVCILGEP